MYSPQLTQLLESNQCQRELLFAWFRELRSGIDPNIHYTIGSNRLMTKNNNAIWDQDGT